MYSSLLRVNSELNSTRSYADESEKAVEPAAEDRGTLRSQAVVCSIGKLSMWRGALHVSQEDASQQTIMTDGAVSDLGGLLICNESCECSG